MMRSIVLIRATLNGVTSEPVAFRVDDDGKLWVGTSYVSEREMYHADIPVTTWPAYVGRMPSVYVYADKRDERDAMKAMRKAFVRNAEQMLAMTAAYVATLEEAIARIR